LGKTLNAVSHLGSGVAQLVEAPG